MSTIEERIQKIEDESAVKDLAARFADSATRGNSEEFRSLWTTDAVWVINEPAKAVCHGIEEIVNLFEKLRKGKTFFVQFVHTGVMKIDNDNASARWIIHEVATGANDLYYNNYGIFSDEMIRQDGKWLFSKRVYDYMWLDHLPFNGDSFKLPDFNESM